MVLKGRSPAYTQVSFPLFRGHTDIGGHDLAVITHTGSDPLHVAPMGE